MSELTPSQQLMIVAVRQGNIDVVRDLIDRGVAKPIFPAYAKTTPLHEAVALGDTAMIKLLIALGADVFTRRWDGITAETLAQKDTAKAEIADILRRERIRRIAQNAALTVAKKRKADAAPQKKSKPRRAKPAFTAATLPDVFAPEKWIGRASDMRKLWQQVSPYLKKKFDFAAALSETQRLTLKKHAPKNPFNGSKKPPSVG